MKVFRALALFGATSLASGGIAHAAILTTGSGDGGVRIDVSDFGSFTSAIYDPFGPVGAADTTFESFVTMPRAGGRARIDDTVTSAFIDSASGTITNVQIVSQSSTQLVTRFAVNLLEFTLNQRVVESLDGGVRVGSALVQEFTIRNTADVPNSWNMVRYLDGDLGFDGSIADSGGRLGGGANTTLFETDSSTADDASLTFLGITTNISGVNTATSPRQFEIDAFSGLRTRVLAGAPLDNTVAGDTNSDGLIDAGAYDVTLAFQDFLSVPAGGTVTYTTATLFGNATLPRPGASEALPLLPDTIVGAAFNFEIDASLAGRTVWIDPVVATGYTYTVTGAQFAAVTAPSLASVNDADGYILTVNGIESVIMAGETVVFATPVATFTLTGINPALGLDPDSPRAFVTGINLVNFGGPTATVSQEAIRFDTGGGNPPPPVSPVPLPAGGLLLGGGLLALAAARRRRA